MLTAVNNNQKTKQHYETTIASSTGDTIVVPDDYSSIQEAVDHANNGDTIYVRIGIYTENIDVYKPLKIIGEERNTTIIEGKNKGDHIFDVTADNVEITRFTIKNTSLGRAGIKIESDNCKVRDNIVHECGDGIWIVESDNVTIQNNQVYHNNFGIYADGIKSIQIIDDVFNANGDGVVLLQSSNVNLVNNKIINNDFNGVLHILCKSSFINKNDIHFNGNIGLKMLSSNDNSIKNTL